MRRRSLPVLLALPLLAAAAFAAEEPVRLVNLPTTFAAAKREILLLIAHHFLPAATTGYDTFYGLDGPASVYLGLGYGITDSLAVTLGRNNVAQTVEAYADWRLAREARGRSPVGLKLRLGGTWVTQSRPDIPSSGRRFAAFGQLSISRRLGPVTLLAVPSYATRTNDPAQPARDTFALGLGARWRIGSGFAAVGDWVPVLSGRSDAFDSWGLGLEKTIGGHVFQVFVTNTAGIVAPAYLGGGDLRLGDGDFRLGFHIFRSF